MHNSKRPDPVGAEQIGNRRLAAPQAAYFHELARVVAQRSSASSISSQRSSGREAGGAGDAARDAGDRGFRVIASALRRDGVEHVYPTNPRRAFLRASPASHAEGKAILPVQPRVLPKPAVPDSLLALRPEVVPSRHQREIQVLTGIVLPIAFALREVGPHHVADIEANACGARRSCTSRSYSSARRSRPTRRSHSALRDSRGISPARRANATASSVPSPPATPPTSLAPLSSAAEASDPPAARAPSPSLSPPHTRPPRASGTGPPLLASPPLPVPCRSNIHPAGTPLR